MLKFLRPVSKCLWLCSHQKVVYIHLLICVCIHGSFTYTYSLHIHFLHFTVNSDGSVTAEMPDGAVSEATLHMVLEWKKSGVGMDEIINRLRAQTVPPGYPVHPWIPG